MNIVHILKVKKSSGELVPFDFQKLKSALLRSGAQKEEIDQIVDDIFEQVYDGISTKKIYQIAYRILKKESHNAAGRYRIKKAIFDLGPSGYPFEKLLGRLFRHEGYEVKVGQIVQGKCITHEVDVVAENETEIVMVECKFHKQQGRKSDVKVALYIKARFDDIHEQIIKENLYPKKKFSGYIATNTRFTDDAEMYGRCSKISLISWDFPIENNLQSWIEKSGFHLITALSSATKKQKELLLEHDIILCRDIIDQPERLSKLGFSNSAIAKLKKESMQILGR